MPYTYDGDQLVWTNEPTQYLGGGGPLSLAQQIQSQGGTYNNFDGGSNGWSVIGGKIYRYRPDAKVPQDVLEAFPLANAAEVSNIINQDAPGNGAGKGSMKEGILSALSAAASMYGAGNLLSGIGAPTLTAANGGIDQGALGQILGTNNPAVIPPGWEYTAKAASDITPTAMVEPLKVSAVTDGVLPSNTTTLADYAAGAEGSDLLQGQAMLDNAGIKYSDLLLPAAGAAAGGLAGAAASGGAAAAPSMSNVAAGASLAGTAAAAGGGAPATDQQLNDAINGSGAPTPSYEDVTGPGGVGNGEDLTSALGGAGALSSITQWAKDNPALLRALGTGAGGILGYIQSNRQAAQLKSLADQYAGYGAPSRARYEATFQPGFSMASDPGYTDALNQASKATMHSLSLNGNPAGSPNAWAQSLADNTAKFAYPALQTYRSQNANSGGISTFNAASPELATGAITAQGQGTNSLGKAAANIFSPAQPTSLADILKLYGQGSGNIFGAAA